MSIYGAALHPGLMRTYFLKHTRHLDEQADPVRVHIQGTHVHVEPGD